MLMNSFLKLNLQSSFCICISTSFQLQQHPTIILRQFAKSRATTSIHLKIIICSTSSLVLELQYNPIEIKLMTENFHTQDLNVSLNLNLTMKDQVEQVDMTIGHFKKLLDGYKRSRADIQFELKKLQQMTDLQCDKIDTEINSRVKYINDTFRNEHLAQEKELDYLQIQNSTLAEQHKRLMVLGDGLQQKVKKSENNVGI